MEVSMVLSVSTSLALKVIRLWTFIGGYFHHV